MAHGRPNQGENGPCRLRSGGVKARLCRGHSKCVASCHHQSAPCLVLLHLALMRPMSLVAPGPPAPAWLFCEIPSPPYLPHRSSPETEQKSHHRLWPRHRTCTEPEEEMGEMVSKRTCCRGGMAGPMSRPEPGSCRTLPRQRPGAQRETQRKIPTAQRSAPSRADGETESQGGEIMCWQQRG